MQLELFCSISDTITKAYNSNGCQPYFMPGFYIYQDVELAFCGLKYHTKKNKRLKLFQESNLDVIVLFELHTQEHQLLNCKP